MTYAKEIMEELGRRGGKTDRVALACNCGCSRGGPNCSWETFDREIDALTAAGLIREARGHKPGIYYEITVDGRTQMARLLLEGK